MKKTTDPKQALQKDADASENDIGRRRQRLADLLGKLLARHWLRLEAQTRGSQADFPAGVGEQDFGGQSSEQ